MNSIYWLLGGAKSPHKIGQSGSTANIVVWDVLEAKWNRVQVKMPPNNHPQVKKKRVTTGMDICPSRFADLQATTVFILILNRV
jgi:hypothetical protein